MCVDVLAEADARVGHQRRRRAIPAARAAVEPLDEEVADLADDVVVARIALHRARLALHVHRRRSRHPRRRRRRSISGSRRPADTSFTMVAPASSAARGHGRLRGVDADRHAGLAGQPLDDRAGPARSSSVGGHRLGAGPGRLAAHVEDVGARRARARGRGRRRRRGRGSGRRRRRSRGSRSRRPSPRAASPQTRPPRRTRRRAYRSPPPARSGGDQRPSSGRPRARRAARPLQGLPSPPRRSGVAPSPALSMPSTNSRFSQIGPAGFGIVRAGAG